MLVFLSLALIGPYLLLTVIGSVLPSLQLAPLTRAKIGLSLFFLVTSSAHFVTPTAMAEMLPPFVPNRLEIIYGTGVLEILGAVGVWVPQMSRFVGLSLIAMLIGILPANIYSAFARVPFGGHEHGPVYLLLRIPFQALVVAWVYWATEQDWLGSFRRKRANDRTPRGAPYEDRRAA